MKKLFITMVFCYFVVTAMYAQGPPRCDDIVTIQGKEFRCGNKLFYPLATTYSFEIMYDRDSIIDSTDYNEFYLARSNSYGPVMRSYDSTYPFGYCYGGYCGSDNCGPMACRNEIINDLTVIHDKLGFNTIRTTFGPIFDTITSTNSHFFLNAFHCPNWPYKDTIFELKPLVPNDPGTYRMFDFFDEILDVAWECKLKVLLDVAYVKTASDNNFSRYLKYLALLGKHIHDSTSTSEKQTLIAYNILEEPAIEQGTYDKTIVCQKVTQMYDTLKYYDPDHLISVGGGDVCEVFSWDPGIMKLDFYTPHLYVPRFKEWARSSDTGVEVVKTNLYWYMNNCPMPWMIGETGFSAIDDEIGRHDTVNPADSLKNWNCGHLIYPRVHGELSKAKPGTIYTQKKYAEDIIKMVRDCGGSGFTYWTFQEAYLAGDPYYLLEENAHGILRHGEAHTGIATYDSGSIYKPVDTVFMHYLDTGGQPPPADPDSVQMPGIYYNPCVGQYDTVFGIVKDQNGYPIKDAVVLGQIWSLKINMYTFTKSDPLGRFELKSPIPNHLGPFNYIEVSYPGSSIADTILADLTGTNFTYKINLNTTDINENVSSETIHSGQSDTLAGLNTLTTTDVYIDSGGIADLYARYEVHIQHEFESFKGSETHIYNAITFPDCSHGFTKKANYYADNLKRQDENKEIELRFKLKKDAFSCNVFPNPCKGEFALSLNYDEKKNYRAVISDMLGNKLQEMRITGPVTKFDVTGSGMGIYFIKIYTDDNIQIKKIIKQ